MNMTLNMIMGEPDFFQIEYRNAQANLCKRVYPETIKNDNGAVAMISLCDANATNKSIKFKKVQPS